MNYKRVTPSGSGYNNVSILSESGFLTTTAVWPDGFTLHIYSGNIFDMGWHSLKEFLRERKGFEPMKN
jgi:hypothetical protein